MHINAHTYTLYRHANICTMYRHAHTCTHMHIAHKCSHAHVRTLHIHTHTTHMSPVPHTLEQDVGIKGLQFGVPMGLPWRWDVAAMGTAAMLQGTGYPRGAQQELRGPQLGPVTNWDKQGVRADPSLCPAGCAGVGGPGRFGNAPAPSPATQGQLEGDRLKKREEGQN